MRGSRSSSDAHDMDVRQVPAACWRARIREDALAQRVGVLARLHDLHQRDALAERRRGPARLRRRRRRASGRSPRSVRGSRRVRDRPCRRRCRPDRACRPRNRSARRSRCAAPIWPSRNAPSAARSAAIAKQLQIVVSGKPQSRQAMKLAKSVSRYAPVSTPSAISPRRISSTRPFHISGLSARSFAKCASISARRATANGQAPGSKRRSSRVSGMIGMSSMRARRRRRATRRSSLDGAFHHDDRAARDRGAGQLAAARSSA